MVDFDKARTYVWQNGTAVEKARLRYILTGTPASAEIVAEFFADQRPDGSWAPFWASGMPSIDATCYHLIQAEYMGLFNSPHAALKRAITFLQEKQAQQGYWEEDTQLRDIAPPWARPGDQSATLYLTANCGFCLARLARANEAGQAASAYLMAHQRDDGTLPSFLHTQWLAASLWYYLAQLDPASRTLTYLQKSLTGEVSSGNLVWMLNSLRDAGIPVAHPLLETATRLLSQRQREDGSWMSDDGPMFDVRTTIEAVRALLISN